MPNVMTGDVRKRDEGRRSCVFPCRVGGDLLRHLHALLLVEKVTHV